MPHAPFLPVVLILALATGAVALAAGAVLTSAPAPDATGSANEALVRRFYAAVNTAIDSGDVAALDPLLAPGFTDHPAPADGTPARADLLGAVLALHAADPHVRVEVETVAAAGETVVVRGRLRRGGTAGAPTIDAAGAVAGGCTTLALSRCRKRERCRSGCWRQRLSGLFGGDSRAIKHHGQFLINSSIT